MTLSLLNSMVVELIACQLTKAKSHPPENIHFSNINKSSEVIFKFVASMTFVDGTFSTKLKPSDSKKMHKVFCLSCISRFWLEPYLMYVINVNLELANNKIVKITIIFSEVNLYLQKSHGDKLYSILYFMQLNLY